MQACLQLADACPSLLRESLKGPARAKVLQSLREVVSNLDKPLCKMAFLKALAVLGSVKDEELEEILLANLLLPPPPDCLAIIYENEEALCSTLDGYVKEWLAASSVTEMKSVVDKAMNELLIMLRSEDPNSHMRGLMLAKVLLSWNKAAQDYLMGMAECKASGEIRNVVSDVKRYREELVKELFSKLNEQVYNLYNMITSIEDEVARRVLEGKELISDIERLALMNKVDEVIRKLQELQGIVQSVRRLSDSAGEAMQTAMVSAARSAIPPTPPKEGKCISFHEALTLRGLVMPQMKKVIEGKMRLGGEEFGGKADPFEFLGALDVKGFVSTNKSFFKRKTKVLVGAVAYHSTIRTQGEDCNCFGLGDLKELLSLIPSGDYVAVAIITPNEICDELKEFFEKGFGINNVGIVIYNPLEDEAVSSGEIGKELEVEARRLFGEEASIRYVLQRLCERFEDSRITREVIANYLNISEREAEEVMKKLAKYLRREIKGGLYLGSEDCKRL